ncbi:MAG: hypothetical protein AAF725_24520, partial [Acidobacteriota bacterium]
MPSPLAALTGLPAWLLAASVLALLAAGSSAGGGELGPGLAASSPGPVVLAVLLAAAGLLEAVRRGLGRPARGAPAFAAVGLLLAVSAGAFLLFDGWAGESLDRTRIERSYGAMWQGLDALAKDLEKDFAESVPPAPGADRLALFETLRRRLEEAGGEDAREIGALLFDPDGEAVAWSGASLLHEPAIWELPLDGRVSRRGFTAVTALSVRSLDGDTRPWRVVVGRSFSLERFPFASELGARAGPRVGSWSLAPRDDEEDPEAPAAGGAWRIQLESGPALVLER